MQLRMLADLKLIFMDGHLMTGWLFQMIDETTGKRKE